MRLLTSQESRGDIVVSFVVYFRLFCHVNILLVLLPQREQHPERNMDVITSANVT